LEAREQEYAQGVSVDKFGKVTIDAGSKNQIMDKYKNSLEGE
jgi:hypothetical protein